MDLIDLSCHKPNSACFIYYLIYSQPGDKPLAAEQIARVFLINN